MTVVAAYEVWVTTECEIKLVVKDAKGNTASALVTRKPINKVN